MSRPKQRRPATARVPQGSTSDVPTSIGARTEFSTSEVSTSEVETADVGTLAVLIEILRAHEKELKSRREDVVKALQVSFLRSKVMDVTLLKTDIVDPVVKSIEAIAKRHEWHKDNATLELIHKIIFEHLRAPDVFGDAEDTLFKNSPVAFVLYPLFFMVHYVL
jgi:hypothetical protein